MKDDGSLWIVVPTGQQAAGGWIDDTLKQRAIEQAISDVESAMSDITSTIDSMVSSIEAAERADE